MSKIVLIGLGVIARYHVLALRQTEHFRLCGVCDLKADLAKDELYQSLPFYTCYKDLLANVDCDMAIIATPPATHYPIARYCIEQGILPIVEKPLAAAAAEGAEFFSEWMRGKYVPVCHTLYGDEVLWMAEHLPLKHISSVRMELSDPYADANGHIDSRYIGLGGSWLDSAPNALAPLLRITPELEEVSVRHLRDKQSGLPYASRMDARYHETKISIDLSWHKGVNHKQTTIIADGKQIVLNHSKQTICVDGVTMFAGTNDRLTQQYANFYKMFPARVPDETTTKYMYDIIYANL